MTARQPNIIEIVASEASQHAQPGNELEPDVDDGHPLFAVGILRRAPRGTS